MVKKAVFSVTGCTKAELEAALKRALGFSNIVPIETVNGVVSVQLKVRSVVKSLNCWELKLSLTHQGGWLWGETFEVCAEEDGSALQVAFSRKKGVGRISADVFGFWILEIIKSENPNVEASITHRF
ncbi:hypothetical protein [Infirmifilum sp. NZ]|uniref:hypothetical protein n=1 Tax=Infirmifilum sp. NZ TaxID=2926850 RepID=UPI00279B9E82|nr:hypothetical protein [Infirmifilum sp. NZ]UNQ72482.1 hypothetical protein MOV14_04945 [Infirmifilum sp. NZ]